MTGPRVRGAVFTDVDGTLTVSRSSTELDLEAVRWMRVLRSHGYAVVLVSGNSVPVLAGLSTYLGLSDAVVAENGCAVYAGGLGLRILCSESLVERLSKVAREVVVRSGGALRESWQNRFRFCDRAFKWSHVGEAEAVAILIRVLREVVENEFIDRVKVESSGYAIHMHARECNKGAGIKKLISTLGWSGVKTYCIGDSITDLPMRDVCEYLVAVSNSDGRLKDVADYVTSKPSSKGFIEFAMKLLAGELPTKATR